MKIAVATKDDWSQVAGHAGRAHDWLVFDCQPGAPLPAPQRVLLTGETVPLHALQKVMAGEALPDTRFDITTALCKVRDLFSTH